jgi:Bacterial pre-peptidase C-terminal domain
MQRLKGRNVLFGALAVLACSGDPTGNESTPTEILSNPEVVFVSQGDSQPVVVQVLDEDGQVLQADFTATNVGSGITVRLDPTFQQVTTGNPIRRGARFFVKGVELAHTSFTVNALGLTKEIEVTSVPGALNAEITDSLPALGDTVTITAAPGTFFSDSSVLNFLGAVPVVTNQTETTISFIPMANIFAPAVVTNVGVASNPTIVFELATPFNVKTDSIADIGTALSTTTPALGAPVTLTLPAGLKLIPESLVTLNVAGAALPPRGRTLSPDSTVITFTPPPNADSFVVVSGVIPAPLAACCGTVVNYPLLLGTTNKLTTPLVDSVPATVSSATPAGGEAVTLTSTDANFVFSETSQVLVGAGTAITTGVAVDGSSLTFVPTPGATGTLTVTDVQVAGFPLQLPSTAGDVTAGTTVTPIAGTDAPGTAPTIEVPGLGITRGFVDNGTSVGYASCGDVGLPCQVYKFTLAADAVFDVTAVWSNTSDVGIYFLEGDGTTLTGNTDCDSHGNDGSPETCTQELAAGTYFLAMVPFGPFYPTPEPNPDWVDVRITGSVAAE